MANGRRPGGAGADIGFGITERSAPGTIPGHTVGTREASPETALIRRISKWIPPDDALSFFMANERDSAVVEVVELVSFQVPPSHIAVVSFLQVLTTNADATFAGSGFTVLINQTPVPGYELIPIFQGGGSQGNVPGDVWIRVRANETIAVRFAHALANPHHVGVQARGHYWPLGAEEV